MPQLWNLTPRARVVGHDGLVLVSERASDRPLRDCPTTMPSHQTRYRYQTVRTYTLMHPSCTTDGVTATVAVAVTCDL